MKKGKAKGYYPFNKVKKSYKSTAQRGKGLEYLFSRSMAYCKHGMGYRFPNRGTVTHQNPADFIWCGEQMCALIETKQVTALDLKFDFYNNLVMTGQYSSLKRYADIGSRYYSFVLLNFSNLAPNVKFRFDETYMIDHRFFGVLLNKDIMKALPLSYIKEHEVDLINSGSFTKIHFFEKGTIPDEKRRIFNLGGVLK